MIDRDSPLTTKPNQPGKSSPSWLAEQVKTKAAAATWSVFLIFGGLIYLLYFSHIGFIPDLELKSSIAILAVAAVTGAFYLITLSLSFTIPNAIWSSLVENSKRFRRLFDPRDNLTGKKLTYWLSPFVGLLLVTIALIVMEEESNPESYFFRHEVVIIEVTVIKDQAKTSGVDLISSYYTWISKSTLPSDQSLQRSKSEYAVLGKNDFDSFFGENKTGWKGLQEKYPNSTLLTLGVFITEPKATVFYTIQPFDQPAKMFVISLTLSDGVWLIDEKREIL